MGPVRLFDRLGYWSDVGTLYDAGGKAAGGLLWQNCLPLATIPGNEQKSHSKDTRAQPFTVLRLMFLRGIERCSQSQFRPQVVWCALHRVCLTGISMIQRG